MFCRTGLLAVAEGCAALQLPLLQWPIDHNRGSASLIKHRTPVGR